MTPVVTPESPANSRLGLYAWTLIEAGGLATLILAPLFFDPHGARPFTLGKASLVRILATVMIVAWIVCRLDMACRPGIGRGGPGRWKALLRSEASANPLALPALMVLATAIVSTIVSVSPSTSLLGSYERSQGLATTASCIVIFYVAAATMRARSQIERVIAVAVITSVPVALYGLIQAYGLDPLRGFLSGAAGPAISTAGNPLFLGAHLVMVIPLTLGLLAERVRQATAELRTRAGRAWLHGGVTGSCVLSATVWLLAESILRELTGLAPGRVPSPGQLQAAQAGFHVALGVAVTIAIVWSVAGQRRGLGGPFARVGVLVVILALQVAGVVVTHKRGPFLGLLAGLAAFAALSGLARSARRMTIGAILVAAALLAGLLAVDVLHAPGIGRGGETRSVARLARVFDLESSTARIRTLVWSGTLRLVLPHAPLSFPSGEHDRLNALRPLVGYGPESLLVTFPQTAPPELASLAGPLASADRAHNEILDAWASTGVAGVTAYLTMVTATFLLALGRLGLIETARRRATFLASWLGTGTLTASTVGLTLGWHFIGAAFVAGMVAGFFLYLAGASLLGDRRRSTPESHAGWVIMLTAALLAHVVETQVGVADTTTRTYWWICLAALVAVGTAGSRRPEPWDVSAGPDAGARLDNHGASRALRSALLTALVLATLAFGLVDVRRLEDGTARVLDVVLTSLTSGTTTGGSRFAPAPLWLFVVTFAVSVVLRERDGVRGLRENVRCVSLFAAVALLTVFASVAAQARLPADEGVAWWSRPMASFPLFVLLVMVVALLVGVTLTWEHQRPERWISRWWLGPVAALLAVVAAGLTTRASVGMVQADMIYAEGSRRASGPGEGATIPALRRALEIQPQLDYGFALLGEAYFRSADRTADAERQGSLARAERALLRARELNPLSLEHTLRLGDLQRLWARRVTDRAEVTTHYERALAYYAEAVRLAPHLPPVSARHAEARREYADFRARRPGSPPNPAARD